MGIPVIDTGPMTVEEFYALTDARPDGEKWELIEGEAVLNAGPSEPHQIIIGNVIFALKLEQQRLHAPWRVIPGIGALVSNMSRPEPDLMVLPKSIGASDPSKRDTRDAIVLFEIMSPSTKSRDLKWKRTAYASLPALMHYVVIAQDAVDVVVFSRTTGFAEQRFKSLSDLIAFPELGTALPLAEIYRDIGFAPGAPAAS
jgi:Uma2 family endonuclease